MDTRFLESFMVLVESASLADAARKLNLTSAALGMRIKVLEDELGFPLVTRAGRAVRPTAAGMKLAVKARGFLADLRDFRAIGSEAHLRGELRLGVATSAMAGAFCDLIPAKAERFPEIDLIVSKGSSSDLYRKFANADLDIVLLYRPPFELPKSSGWETVIEEPYVVLGDGSSAHRTAHDLLRTEPFIRYDRSLWSGQLADSYLNRAGIAPNEILELDSLEAIAVLVNRGFGVSLIPDWSGPWPEGLGVAKIPLPDVTPKRQLGTLWSKGSSRIHLIDAILDLMLEHRDLT